MKLLYVWLLMLQDATGQHIVVALASEQACTSTATALNTSAGPARQMRWHCDRLKVER